MSEMMKSCFGSQWALTVNRRASIGAQRRQANGNEVMTQITLGDPTYVTIAERMRRNVSQSRIAMAGSRCPRSVLPGTHGAASLIASMHTNPVVASMDSCVTDVTCVRTAKQALSDLVKQPYADSRGQCFQSSLQAVVFAAVERCPGTEEQALALAYGRTMATELHKSLVAVSRI